jgi:zinc transport system permease protein
MIEWLDYHATEWLQHSFMQRALVAILLASVACGIVGTYVVVRKMLFISGGVSHASLGGVGMGIYLGTNLVGGALIFALASALGIGAISRRGGQAQDIAIAMIWVTGMALGFVFDNLASGYQGESLESYLFGLVQLVPTSDLILIAVLDAVIVMTVLLLYREFLALSFDEEFGKVIGIPVERLYYVLICLIALTVVILVGLVGVLLAIALIAVPPAIARQYTHTLWKMMLLSVLLSALVNTFALWLSFYWLPDLSPGPLIALVNVAAFVLSLSFCRLRDAQRSKRALPETRST